MQLFFICLRFQHQTIRHSSVSIIFRLIAPTYKLDRQALVSVYQFWPKCRCQIPFLKHFIFPFLHPTYKLTGWKTNRHHLLDMKRESFPSLRKTNTTSMSILLISMLEVITSRFELHGKKKVNDSRKSDLWISSFFCFLFEMWWWPYPAKSLWRIESKRKSCRWVCLGNSKCPATLVNESKGLKWIGFHQSAFPILAKALNPWRFVCLSEE